MICSTKHLVENMVVYSQNSQGVYRGIHKAYFPKWIGWGMINAGEPQEAIEVEVCRFYSEHFYEELYLYVLSSQATICAIMNFSTLHGKKKVLQKIHKVTGTESLGEDLMRELMELGKCGEYHLLLEFMEFYSFTGDINKIEWLTRAYRCL